MTLTHVPVAWPPDETAGVSRVANVLGTGVTVAFERSGVFSAELALVNHGRYRAARWLVVHFRFADCDLDHAPDGGNMARTTLPVDYRVFGLHRTEAVPLSRFALSVPSGACDHPKL
jgi:hypothetical protein